MGSLDLDRDPILVLDLDRSSSLALEGLETDRVFVETRAPALTSPQTRRDPDLPADDAFDRDGGTP